MRLTVVTETYPPEINGVAMTWGKLASGLAELGLEVTVVRPRQKPGDRGGLQAGVREVTVQGVELPGYPQVRLGWPDAWSLVQEFRRHRPDLVHIVTEGPLGWAALWCARRMGLRITSSYHTHFQQYTGHYGFAFLGRIAAAYLRALHNRTLCTFGPTPALLRELEADGFRNLRVLSRGVDTRLFDPMKRSEGLRQRWGAGEDTPVVVHSSRLAPEKNYRVLLDSFRALRAARPDARFVLIGDGPLRRQLEEEAPWCIFTGFLNRPELAVHLASADIYVHASESETFGNVVTEALASGLAFAGYNYAAAARFVRDGWNGRAVPAGDASALLRAAVELGSDIGRARELGRRGRETALTVSWDEVIRRFATELEEFARGSPAGIRETV